MHVPGLFIKVLIDHPLVMSRLILYIGFLELNRLIKKLDKRWRRKCDAGGWRFKPKERNLSTPSTSQPPIDYAECAVTL